MQAVQSGSRFVFAAFATLLFVCMARADEPGSDKDEIIASQYSASLEAAAQKTVAGPVDMSTVYWITSKEIVYAQLQTRRETLGDGEQRWKRLNCRIETRAGALWSCTPFELKALRTDAVGDRPALEFQIPVEAPANETRRLINQALLQLFASTPDQACRGGIKGAAMQHAGMLEAFSSGKGPEFRFEPHGNTFLINHTPYIVTYHGPFAGGWIRLHCWDPGDELEGGSIE